MASNLLLYQLLLIALVLLCLLVHVGLSNDSPCVPKMPLDPKPRRRRCSKEPKPCTGLIPYSQNIQTRFPTGGYASTNAHVLACLPLHSHHTQRDSGRHRLRGEAMDWTHLLAYITGIVDQALLLRNEYLMTENRMLRNQITGRVRLTDGERTTLAAIGQKLGKQALKEVATIVTPETMLGWHGKLVAQQFDGSKQRRAPGRPTIDPELEALVIRLA